MYAVTQIQRCSLLAIGIAALLVQASDLCAQEPILDASWLLQPEETEVAPLDIFGGIDQPPEFAEQPPAPRSSLLERLDELTAPGASALLLIEQPLEIETVQLTSNSPLTTSNSRVRRSQVSMQPNVRGYQQQSVLGQYQGAQFVPVRFDLDSVLTSIDPGIIDRLVIVPGPYGVRYGPGLAFIDVAAVPLPRNEVFDWTSRTSLLYRSNGGQAYGRQMITIGGPTYGVRASHGHKVGSDYVSGDGTRIPASYDVLDTNVAMSFDLSEKTAIQFEYLQQTMADTEFAGLAFDARIRQTDGFFLRYDYSDTDCETAWFAEGWYNRTFFEGNNVSDSKQNFYQPNPVFVPPFSFIGFTDADVTSSGGRLVGEIGNTGSGQLTGGVDLKFFDGELNEFDDFGGFGFDSFPIPRAHMLDMGAFAELLAPVLSDSQIRIGARVDWVRTEQPAVFTSVDPDGIQHIFDNGSDFADSERLYHAFVTADHPLGEELTLRAGFGHGQRPPNLTERFAQDPFLTLVQNATSAVIGDPFLNAERASQFDLTLLGDYEFVRFQLNGFYSYVEDHITLTPAIGVPPDPDLRLLDFVNHDSVFAGAEASGEIDLTGSLLASGRVSYVDGRDRILNEPLFGIYPLQSRFGLLWYDPVDNRYGVEFIAWVVDNQDRIATALFEMPTPGFAKFDMRAYVQATDAMRVTIGFENIGNRNYLEHLSVHNPAVLEPGFNFYLATQIEL